MEQAYHRVDLMDETLAILCPYTDEVCEHEACYASLICLENGERVIPERKAA